MEAVAVIPFVATTRLQYILGQPQTITSSAERAAHLTPSLVAARAGRWACPSGAGSQLQPRKTKAFVLMWYMQAWM